MNVIKKVLSAIFVLSISISCIAKENDDWLIVKFDVAIPALPTGWRMPTSDELDHIMRPQSLNLFPDYLIQISIDDDSIFDWVVLAVKTDNSLEGLLIYLSSRKRWEVVATDNFDITMKIDMTLVASSCDGKTSITYSALGRPGVIYSWDSAKKVFVSREENINFE